MIINKNKSSNNEIKPVKILTNKLGFKIGEVYKEDDKLVVYKNKEKNIIIGEIKDNSLILDSNTYELLDDCKNRMVVKNSKDKVLYRLFNKADYDLMVRIRNAKIAGIIGKIFVYVFLIILAIVVLFPFYWMINTSLKTYSEFQQTPPTYWPHRVMWTNYLEAFKKANLGYLFLNTVYVGVVSTLLSLVITVLAAFAFARLSFPGRDLMFSMMLGTMMIPGEMFTITNYSTVYKVDSIIKKLYLKAVKNGNKTGGIFGRVKRSVITSNIENITPFQNLLLNLNINSSAIWASALGDKTIVYEAATFSNTYAVLIIPFLVSIYYIYLLRQNFKQIPNELYLAAKVDGTSDFGYLLKVMLPLSAPTIVTITILKMMGAWNSYVWPRLVANTEGMKLITNGIRSASFLTTTNETDYPLQMAAVVIVTIPLFLVFLCFRKYIMRGVSKSGTKG